jgi:hypothetical protein
VPLLPEALSYSFTCDTTREGEEKDEHSHPLAIVGDARILERSGVRRGDVAKYTDDRRASLGPARG